MHSYENKDVLTRTHNVTKILYLCYTFGSILDRNRSFSEKLSPVVYDGTFGDCLLSESDLAHFGTVNVYR